MMKHSGIRILLGTLMFACVGAAVMAAEGQRTIVFNEDRSQHYMTTKI